MNYNKLLRLKDIVSFSRQEVADTLEIKPASARVFCSRYVKNGFLVRLKRDFYTLKQTWEHLETADLFSVANLLQVPSYVSFMTALSYYEATTQVFRNFFESACLKRSKKINIEDASFVYYKLKKPLYFDFVKKRNFFIATKEKALMDSLYLYSFGRYKLDLDSLDFRKFDKNKLKSISKAYPSKTRELAKRLCKI